MQNTPTTNPVIWSKFGLWREVTRAELAAGKLVDHDQPLVDLDTLGYCLTHIDCEPVAILPAYPDDEEPAAVLEWLANTSEWEAE
jgi:hypothetical protein